MIHRCIAIALAGALAACSSPPAPKDTFYRLNAAAPVARFTTPPVPGVLEVDRLDTDGVLAERALTYQDGKGLQRYRYDFWSEPPGRLVQDALTRALTDANAAAKVVTPDLRVPPAYTLRGKLRRFEQLAGSGAVAIELQLALVSARDGSLVLQNTYETRAPARDETPAAAVEALEGAVNQIIGRFLADLGAADIPVPRR